MSDREYCKDCQHCLYLPYHKKYKCDAPLPGWAEPGIIVDPDVARTCAALLPKDTDEKSEGDLLC